MESATGLRGVLSKYKPYFPLFLILAFSIVLFHFAYLFQHQFSHIIDSSQFLTWHNIFEFAAMLVCFAIFVAAYFTYEQTRSLNSIVVGAFFLAAGILDAFHTLSYLGMPPFFIENETANRATTFWIVSRLVTGSGLLIYAFLPKDRKTPADKRLFSAPAIVLPVVVLLFATYRPGFIPVMYMENKGLSQTKITLEYIVIALFMAAAVKELCGFRKSGDRLSVMLTGALLFNIFSEFAFVSYSSVYDIYNYLGHVYKVIASYLVFRVIFIHNVQRPYKELTEAQAELTLYAGNLDRLVDQRTRQLRTMNEKLLEDLEYAKDIQKALLPQSLPASGRAEFSTRYRSAERVSGDFYSVFKADEDNIGFYIGDVSGHGVPAAMLTIFVNQCIRSMSGPGGANAILAPSAVLRQLYDAFNNTNFSDEMYIVMLYGVYNTKTMEITYSSAGLNAQPYIIREKGIERLEIYGLPICKLKDIYNAEFNNHSAALSVGDSILFHTDGLVDAVNASGERFSEERLEAVLGKGFGKSPEELSQAIEKSLSQFTGEAVQKDDITFFIIKAK